MNKGQILEKCKTTMEKEECVIAESKGIKLGFIMFTVVYSVLLIYNFANGRSSDIYEISALFWTFMATINYQKYKMIDKNRKIHLFICIVSGLAAIVYFIDYILITGNITFGLFG